MNDFVTTLQAAQSGVHAAIEKLMECFENDVRIVCGEFDLGGSPDLSRSDLTQVVWVKIWIQIGRFKMIGGDADVKIMFGKWIRRTARNEIINVMRKKTAKKRSPELSPQSIDFKQEIDDEFETPGAMIVRKEELERLRSAVGQLKQDYQILIEECFFNGTSTKDFGLKMDMTYDQVRRQLAKAVESLKKLMPSS